MCIQAYRDGTIAGAGTAVPEADRKGAHRPQSKTFLL
jgi:hypothetical protein